MITNTEMANVLSYMNRANLNSAKENQTSVWMDAISTALPDLRMKVAEDAARWLALNRTAADRNTWITPGDFVQAVQAVRGEYLRAANINASPMIGAPSVYDDCPDYADDSDISEWRRRVAALIRDGYPAPDVVAHVNTELSGRRIYTAIERSHEEDRNRRFRELSDRVGIPKALELMAVTPTNQTTEEN